MSETNTTTTTDPDYHDEAIIAFQGRSGSLANPPQLGDSRRYVIAGNCVKVSEELQDNGDIKQVCTIKARNVYEIGVRNPDDGAGLFREPCPHCGHAETPGDVVDGFVDDEDGSDEPAAIAEAQLAIAAAPDDIVDAEVIEDDETPDDGDDPTAGDVEVVDENEDWEVTDVPETGDDDDPEPDEVAQDYEPSGMDEFVAQADAETVEEPADPEPEETPQQRRNRLARERRAAKKAQQEQADDESGDDE
ncbi:hypothetical protein SEA_TYPHA_67 [Mycobacterium phage Typha]|uniref:Uncharacterized protein n=1 Tax=Mycobacterium phage Typha TaxID=2517971 RepID=A0A482JDN9_9CAUD|nr:hypothetical protein KCH40_gp102 [Mycobacterium phage Typha]QBP29722.1 hypothetical protein SEA_TYPHA_67 [Mycobacterium phage Typha]